MKYFTITSLYENGDKWVTRRDTFKGMNKLVREIMKDKDIFSYTVTERQSCPTDK